MANIKIPYLCGGTFLSQILRARPQLTSSGDHMKCQKEKHSEQETFRRLVSIFQLSDFLGGTSLKPYTSRYKSCKNSLTAYTQFCDSDLRLAFDNAVKEGNPKVLNMMAEFVGEFINVEEKGEQLVRCLLGIIENDETILPQDEFFIENGKSVTKKKLDIMNSFTIEFFLLGVWHYIIMNRSEKNENGADTYKSWYPGKDGYRGTVGNDISRSITVKTIPAFLLNNESKNEILISKTNQLNTIEELYSETDRLLLQEFTTDYDELVMKCIGINFIDVIIDEPICEKITSLYNNKWCTKADEFESLSLKPYVWALLNHLNELCNTLQPCAPYVCSPSLRQIKIKLRNLYVKLHPSDHANIFLYDAIYDDWSLGEDY